MKQQEIIVEATGKPSSEQARSQTPWTDAEPVTPRQKGAARLIKLFIEMMKDQNYQMPTGLKVILGVAMLYIISPLDVVPDFFLGLGQIDDVTVLAAALTMLAKEIGRYESKKFESR